MTSLEEAVAGLQLWPHHVETLRNVVDRFEPDPTVLAVLFGGSLAHGYGRETSDIDLVVVVTREEMAWRRATLELTHASDELATYEGGYTDAKFVDLDFLRDVAARGSEPARWAYDGARVLFSREPELAGVLTRVATYPEEGHEERVRSFAAQLAAWRWFFCEGAGKDNAYVQTTALAKLVLFACRLTLAHNRTLYPFHKWVLRVVEDVPDRPADLLERIDALLAAPDQDQVDSLASTVLEHFGHDPAEVDRTWGTRFLLDTELTWQRGGAPVDDL